jgi:transcriptional regulator with XRE-family HTH domain
MLDKVVWFSIRPLCEPAAWRKALGALLRSRRTSLGLTASEVAALVGTSDAQVYRWEAGTVAPSVLHMLRLAELLQLQLTDLPSPWGDGHVRQAL